MNDSNHVGQDFTPPAIRDHLANERTLLAWMRTALTVIGLGFIVDRLAVESDASGVLGIAGIGLVVLGGLVAALGGYSYTSTRRQMATGTYRPHVGLHLVTVAIVVIGAGVVATYLLLS